MPTPAKTIRDLVDLLNRYRDAYYNRNISMVTDKQYDQMFDELTNLEKEYGIIYADSPTQQVGYSVVSSLKKVEHAYPLLSLDKTQQYSGAAKFSHNNPTLFMYKCDGLTIQLTYTDGALTRAETRGDGFVGEDITHNAVTFNVPKTIPYDGVRRITGEAIIKYDDFLEVNDMLTSDEKFSTPRNLVSGSVRQLDSSVCASRKVTFLCWNANDLSEDGTMSSGLEKARERGFSIAHYVKATGTDYSEDRIKTVFENMRSRADMENVPIDGIVCIYDDIQYGASLGRTAHHFRNGLAFKFYDADYPTIIKDIEFTIGKSGVLTPTAVFNPVEIDGVTVTRASVHNISILEELNLCIGDCVDVYRANEVIPQIRLNKTKHDNPKAFESVIPDKCPYCGHPTHFYCGNDAVTLVCGNEKCSGVLLEQFNAFVGRNAMDIRGLSEKTVKKFIDLGYISTYSDIYTNIEANASAIAQLDGFGEKSVSELIKAINKSRETTLDRVLAGLSIYLIGGRTAEIISDYFNSDAQKFYDFITDPRFMVSSPISGVGDVAYTSLLDWFKSEDNQKEFTALCNCLNIKAKKRDSKSTKFAGKHFVITGSVNTYKNREELAGVITANGGTVQSGVSKTTDYLINNDAESTSGKNKKAKELGVPIITEEEFNKMLSESVSVQDDEPKPTTGRFF